MNLVEFKDQVVLRTLNDLGELSKNSIHMSAGAVTELHKELLGKRFNDTVPVCEELGDTMFFLVGFAHWNGLALCDQLEDYTPGYHIDAFMELLDDDKALLAYGKRKLHPFDLQAKLDLCFSTLNMLSNNLHTFLYHEVNAREISGANLALMVDAKLKKRYEKRFSEQEALSRDTVAEYKAMEENL